ncbi:dephospho-CoA kinase, partial [bacterium]
MIIGVTGSIGTGKTTVARMLGRLGAYVIDADAIVHRILDKPARKKLAAYVFDNEEALKKLCGRIHPKV